MKKTKAEKGRKDQKDPKIQKRKPRLETAVKRPLENAARITSENYI